MPCARVSRTPRSLRVSIWLFLAILQCSLGVVINLMQLAPVHAQVAGCEDPPIDEPDNDGDECYTPPDPSKTDNLGDPNNPDTNISPIDPGQSGADPINFATGNMFMTQRDYAGASVFPLTLDRIYNSQSQQTSSSLGPNWSHNYSASLKQSSDTVVIVTRADQKTLRFTLANGAWTPSAGVNSRLRQIVDSTGSKVGWIYTTGDDRVETFDAFGLLRSIANRAGVTQSLSYGPNGLLMSVSDPFGRKLWFSYDPGGRLIGFKDPSGRLYEYSYDADKNLSSVTYPDGSTRQYLHENAGQPSQITGLIDEDGARYVTWTYDSAGHALSSSLPGGANRVSVSYDFLNGITTVTDALGHATSFDYMTVGGVQRTLHLVRPAVSGGVTQNSYFFDPNGNVNAYLDFGGTIQDFFNGTFTQFTYDLTRNLQTSVKRLDGRITNTSWHPTFRLPTLVQTSTLSDQRTYDAAGNLIQRVLTDSASGTSRSWFYTYNSFGEPLTVTDPAGHLTQLSYDRQGNLSQFVDALGHRTVFRHDADGRIISTTDANGLNTSYEYDARGRLAKRAVRQGLYVYKHDAAGNLTDLLQPGGYNLHFSLDSAHRLTGVTDSLGHAIRYALDAAGKRISETHFDENGRAVYSHGWAYDALNRVVQDLGAQNQVTSYTYDDAGNKLSVRDPLNHLTAFNYDSVNRLVQLTAADGGVTAYAYDSLDRLVSVLDPRGLQTSYSVDALGDQLGVTNPDSGTRKQTVDANGHVLSRIDANGNQLTYRYDVLGRVTQIANGSTSQALESFYYDQTDWLHRNGIGHLTSMVDSAGSTDFSYDSLGHVIRKTQRTGSAVLVSRYRYQHGTGNLTTQVLPSGTIIRYDWSKGRISQMRLLTAPSEFDFADDSDDNDDEYRRCNTLQVLSRIQWEPFGGVRGWVFGNGETEQRVYDLDGRVVSDFVDGAIEFDPASRVSAIVPAGAGGPAPRSYSYDAVGRLMQVADPNNDFTYQYDAGGNRTALTTHTERISYTLDPNSNRLLGSSQGAAYLYDANGSLTSEQSYQYSYDLRGRLARATTAAGTELYFYNGLGQRVRKAGTINGVFAYDERHHLIGEYTAGGIPIEETVYLGDVPVAVVKPNGVAFIHADFRNAPRRIDDANGHPVWTWDPISFGGDLPNETPRGSRSRFTYNLRFPGQMYDAETGLHYNYLRDYNPRTGRFDESDPIGLRGGLNSYTYVANAPINATDPSGLCQISVRFTSLGGVGPLTYYHAYIVTTNPDGTQNYFRGGPAAAGPSSGALSSASGGSSSGSSQSSSCDSTSGNSSNSTSPGAGPGGPGASTGPWGPIATESGPYVAGTIDYEAGDVPNVTVLDNGEPCTNWNASLQMALNDVANAQIPYNPLSTNSNSTVQTILGNSGLTPPDPPVWVPGWSTQLVPPSIPYVGPDTFDPSQT